MGYIPNPNDIFPNQYKTTCFIKNVVTAPNVSIGDYTYYDDTEQPTEFEKNNIRLPADLFQSFSTHAWNNCIEA